MLKSKCVEPQMRAMSTGVLAQYEVEGHRFMNHERPHFRLDPQVKVGGVPATDVSETHAGSWWLSDDVGGWPVVREARVALVGNS